MSKETKSAGKAAASITGAKRKTQTAKKSKSKKAKKLAPKATFWLLP